MINIAEINHNGPFINACAPSVYYKPYALLPIPKLVTIVPNHSQIESIAVKGQSFNGISR